MSAQVAWVTNTGLSAVFSGGLGVDQPGADEKLDGMIVRQPTTTPDNNSSTDYECSNYIHVLAVARTTSRLTGVREKDF